MNNETKSLLQNNLIPGDGNLNQIENLNIAAKNDLDNNKLESSDATNLNSNIGKKKIFLRKTTIFGTEKLTNNKITDKIEENNQIKLKLGNEETKENENTNIDLNKLENLEEYLEIEQNKILVVFSLYETFININLNSDYSNIIHGSDYLNISKKASNTKTSNTKNDFHSALINESNNNVNNQTDNKIEFYLQPSYSNQDFSFFNNFLLHKNALQVFIKENEKTKNKEISACLGFNYSIFLCSDLKDQVAILDILMLNIFGILKPNLTNMLLEILITKNLNVKKSKINIDLIKKDIKKALILSKPMSLGFIYFLIENIKKEPKKDPLTTPDQMKNYIFDLENRKINRLAINVNNLKSISDEFEINFKNESAFNKRKASLLSYIKIIDKQLNTFGDLLTLNQHLYDYILYTKIQDQIISEDQFAYRIFLEFRNFLFEYSDKIKTSPENKIFNSLADKQLLQYSSRNLVNKFYFWKPNIQFKNFDDNKDTIINTNINNLISNQKVNIRANSHDTVKNFYSQNNQIKNNNNNNQGISGSNIYKYTTNPNGQKAIKSKKEKENIDNHKSNEFAESEQNEKYNIDNRINENESSVLKLKERDNFNRNSVLNKIKRINFKVSNNSNLSQSINERNFNVNINSNVNLNHQDNVHINMNLTNSQSLNSKRIILVKKDSFKLKTTNDLPIILNKDLTISSFNKHFIENKYLCNSNKILEKTIIGQFLNNREDCSIETPLKNRIGSSKKTNYLNNILNSNDDLVNKINNSGNINNGYKRKNIRTKTQVNSEYYTSSSFFRQFQKDLSNNLNQKNMNKEYNNSEECLPLVSEKDLGGKEKNRSTSKNILKLSSNGNFFKNGNNDFSNNLERSVNLSNKSVSNRNIPNLKYITMKKDFLKDNYINTDESDNLNENPYNLLYNKKNDNNDIVNSINVNNYNISNQGDMKNNHRSTDIFSVRNKITIHRNNFNKLLNQNN